MFVGALVAHEGYLRFENRNGERDCDNYRGDELEVGRLEALYRESEGDYSAVYYCTDYNSRELERETARFVYEDDFADYNRGETDDDCTLTHVYECGAVVKLCDKAAGKRNERI